MSRHCIHVFGASGSGTSTLGGALAHQLSVRHFDADDYYWQLTDPPYTVKNSPQERVRRLLKNLEQTDSWVLSGSVVSWGDAFIPLFSLAVFVTLPHDLRMQRLSLREKQRYGSRIEPSGDMYEPSKAFLDWAALYDTAGPELRSCAVHEQWLKRLRCPVVRVQSLAPAEEISADILSSLKAG